MAIDRKTVAIALGSIRFLRRDNSTLSQFSDEIRVAFPINVSFADQNNDVKMDRNEN